MKKIYLIIAFLSSSMAFAQQAASRYNTSIVIVKSFYPNEFTHYFKSIYDSYSQDPIFLSKSPIINFTKSSLYYEHSMGSLRLGQVPDKTYRLGIGSHGIYRHKNILFFGDLQMERFYEKQKAWNISHLNPNEYGIISEPHYFGVSLPADWNNQKYHIKGGAILPIINEKWDVLLSADYTLQEHYRTETDPRAKINYVQWVANAQTAFTFDKDKISIGGHIGYTNTQNNITFTDLLNDSPDKYNRYLKWQLGYGYLQNRPYKTTKNRDLQYGANVGYHHLSGMYCYWGSIAYNHHHYDTYQNNSRNTDDEDNSILANYKTDGFSLRANYLNNAIGLYKHLFIGVVARAMQGKNYLNKLQGSNYLSSQNDISLTAALLKLNEKGAVYDLGLKARYYQHYQKDGLAQTSTDIAFLELKPYYSTEINFYKKGSFVPTFAIGYRAALHSELTNQNIDYHKPLLSSDYAAQTTHLFYDEVVYPAQAYFAKNQYSLHFSGDFKFYLGNKKTLCTGVYSEYQSTLERSLKARYHFGAHLSVVSR